MNGSMNSGELLKQVRYFALNYKKETYKTRLFKDKEVKSFQIAEDIEIVMGEKICSLLVSSTIIGGHIDLYEHKIRAKYLNDYNVFEFDFMVYDDFTDHKYNYFENMDIFITMEFFIFKNSRDKKYLR